MIYLIYPHLYPDESFGGLGIGWAHRSELKEKQVEDVMGLPPYYILDDASRKRLTKPGVYKGKVKARLPPTTPGKTKGIVLLEAYLIPQDEKEKMKRDLKHLMSNNTNKGWGDGSGGGSGSGSYESVDREDQAREERVHGGHDRHDDRANTREGRSRYMDRDRDRAEDTVFVWWGMAYTFSEAMAALERSANSWGGASKSALAKGHELVDKWLDREIRVPKDLGVAFLEAAIGGKITLSPMTEALLYGAILEGRLRLGFRIEELAAAKLLSLPAALLRPSSAMELHHFFERKWESLPPTGPPAATLFTSREDAIRISRETPVIYQPTPQAFVDSTRPDYYTFSFGSTFDAMGSLISRGQCQFRWQALHFIKNMYRLDFAAFVPYKVPIALIKNHFLLSDKHEMRPTEATMILEKLLEDETITMIFLNLRLFDHQGPGLYRFIHFVLSGTGIPGVPAYRDLHQEATHANALVFDKLNKTFKLFEPHLRGVPSKHETRHLKLVREEKEGLYEIVKTWAAGMGFSEAGYVCANIPGERGVQKGDNLCASWSLFYMALQLMNPGLDEKVLRSAMSYETLGWFLFFFYKSLPNLGVSCSIKLEYTEVVGDKQKRVTKEIEWPHSATLCSVLPLTDPPAVPGSPELYRGTMLPSRLHPRFVRPRAIVTKTSRADRK